MRRSLPLFISVLTLILTSLSQAQPVCVHARNAQLRKGPGTNYGITWTVGQLMPFMKIGEKNGWAHVKDLDGQSHWILAKLLTQRYACAVVKAKQARLRKAPDPRAPASEPEIVDRYTPFKKIDREGGWIQVEDDHQTEYWIAESALWAPIMRTSVRF